VNPGTSIEHHDVLIVGAGQSGLSMSACLKARGIDHVVLEKHQAVHTWHHERWDSFCLVTPNWQCALPGYPYRGPDPHGFMVKSEILDYLRGFIEHVDAPLHEGVSVERVKAIADGFEVTTSKGVFHAGQVVIASGGYQNPIMPRFAERIPPTVQQIHSQEYKNPGQLRAGSVLVVGSGQSGAQIAEDLHLAGRRVILAVGDAPRCARFYRGRDVTDWLDEMGVYDVPIVEHPSGDAVRNNTNHYLTGRDGGRDIDLRRFAKEGMTLMGRLEGLDGTRLRFRDNLAACLDSADATYNRINASIDAYIEKKGIAADPGFVYQPVWTPTNTPTELDLQDSDIACIVWCIGFLPDFGFVDAPVFNGKGAPCHLRGVTREPGLYFLGLPWLHTWGSGRFASVGRDAEFIAEKIHERLAKPEVRSEALAA
jgi:putative flavoprotein involved in K+ transport